MKKPDLLPVFKMVSPSIKKAAKEASAIMNKYGIRHALIGGLAVGAYGYIRATKDVDFLVGEEAFVKHESGIVTIKEGIPFSLGDIPVDSLGTFDEPFLDEAVDYAWISEKIPVLPIAPLILLKLKAGRRQDIVDIRKLYEESGLLEWESIREYLEEHKPDLVDLLDEILSS